MALTPAPEARAIVRKSIGRPAIAKLAIDGQVIMLDACAGSALPRELPAVLSKGTRAFMKKDEGDGATADVPKWERGINTPDLREFFLTGGAQGIAGILTLRRKDQEWAAAMNKSFLPFVLSKTAVDEAIMPPLGQSALPKSLENVVPPRYRYWEQPDPTQALAMRNALVESGMFDDRLIKVVDGSLRLCVEQLYLYEPDEMKKCDPARLVDNLSRLLPAEKNVVTPTTDEELIEHAASTDNVLVISAQEADGLVPWVDTLIKAAPAASWFVEHDDTPDARSALARLGPVFKLRDGEPRIFVASFAMNDAIVEEIAKETVQKPFAGFKDFDACFAAQRRDGKSEESANKICGALQRDNEKAEKAVEKMTVRRLVSTKLSKGEDRYVLGIVLEPETVDAQEDIYSEAEIANAAHTFMEKYRTMGLMHKGAVNDKVKILESYVAPTDFEIEGVPIKKGTWLMAIRVLDDDLWKQVKEGNLTGFSIGGSAIRKPDATAPAAAA